VPEVETGHDVQPDVFLGPRRAFQTPVNGVPPLGAHAAEHAGPLGDVVFEEVDPRVGALPQVGGGHVRHAGGLLVVVGDHVVHVRVGVGELFERLVFCSTERKKKNMQWEALAFFIVRSEGLHGTGSEGVSVDDSGEEAAQSPHGEVADVTAELLPDLLPLKPALGLRNDTDI